MLIPGKAVTAALLQRGITLIVTSALSGVALGQDSAGCSTQPRYTILVHGGTAATAADVTAARREAIHAVVSDAQHALAAGAAAVDVVVDAIVKLENSGLMDAGKGSFRNTAGYTETDASLMDGRTGKTGAVAAMQRLKNPILAARLVMDKTPHVFFAGPTGEDTLIGLGAEAVADPQRYFVPYTEPAARRSEAGTVGAVALDRCGNLAAGTSTGGYPGKLPGRVGDSPMIGASTFANDRVALSATGKGENFIRRAVTLDIAKRVEYQGVGLQEAADHVVHRLLGEIDGVDGGVIAIGRDGEIVLSAVNVAGVLHGYASESKSVTVGLELPRND
jgi:isoaspartyl peptidase/L-asparaginase-like protein (Ntn-hydrolase superfamily)